LEGLEEDGVLKFLGVPFAQPPVGALRWAPPKPAAAWSGVRPAKAFGPAAMQAPIAPSYRTSGMSEDCLYLNVWTTSLSRTARQPVMVWIHGGGNIGGAASEAFTDGSNLAKLGVTVVAANYRLGAFGFANDPVLGANFGILDQIAALRWVQENIEAFGGDPSRVLVFGYSAGAVDIRLLLQSPEAKGLFQRCVMQSGGGDAPAATPSYDSARSRAATQKLFKALGTTDIDALRAVPAERVAGAARPLSGIGAVVAGPRTPYDLAWMPAPDGKVILDDRYPAWGADMPAIFASCQNEARYFLDPARTYTPEIVEAYAKKLTGPKAGEVMAILDAEGGSPLQKLDHLFTDIVWWESQYASLQQFSREGRRVYYYRFARLCPGSAKDNRLVFHGSDVYYVFGNLIDREYDEVDRRISRELQQVYVEFARTGVPKGPNGAVWPAFRGPEPQATIVGDQISSGPYPMDPITRAMYPLRAKA
jgi:para-nitrobenzyl esterase